MSYLPTSEPLLLKTGRLTISCFRSRTRKSSESAEFSRIQLLFGLCWFPRSTTNLVARLQHHIRPVRPRHAAVNQYQIVFFVDLYELDIADCDPLIAVAAGHALALLHAAATAVGRQSTGSTHVAMHLFHAVRCPLTSEIVAF